MSEAIIAAMKMARDAGLHVTAWPDAVRPSHHVTVSGDGFVLSANAETWEQAAKFIEDCAIELGQPRTVSMEDARAVCEGTLFVWHAGMVDGKRVDLCQPSETPSAGIDPEPAAAPVTLKTIRERVLSVAKAGEDRVAARWALTQAAHELRQVPSQSFWNAADELEGIVRDKRDPHAEVPA